MSAEKGFKIRTMTRPELDYAIQWAADEGWNPGLHDADPFFAADPDGFLLGLWDGKPVAAVSAVRYGPAYAFMGFFLVLPEYRGGLLGGRIGFEGLNRLGNAVIGLDGVVAQQDNYKRAGFELAFRSYRFSAPAGGRMPDGLSDLGGIPFEQLAAYDLTRFPAPRREFLQSWISRPGVKGLAVLEGHEMRGYGVLRPCREGYKIGPLFADSQQAAELIYQGLCSQADQGPVLLDAPANNPLAMELVKRHNLAEVFETARMYKNGAPNWAADKVYGITSFELG